MTAPAEYPDVIPKTLTLSRHTSLGDFLEFHLHEFAFMPAFSCLGKTMTYGELDEKSRRFAAWLQTHAQMQPGDRIAIQMPNLLQYPIVAFGALRAGLVLVNTNPLYTEREMEHQFNDSGARLLVVFEDMADKAMRVKPNTGIEDIVCVKRTDFLPSGSAPPQDSNDTVPFRETLSAGGMSEYTRVVRQPDDVAVLQYTGGTTGVAKGAALTHRNLIANTQQTLAYFKLALETGKEDFVAPLPLYHIYAFTVHFLVLLGMGNHSILIPNPRDIPEFVAELSKWHFSGIAGLNTLFLGLMSNADFQRLDFSTLKLTISGGMALTQSVAQRWEQTTGCSISEGYGLTETSPVVSFNPPGHNQVGTIGIPAPDTEVKVIDKDGIELDVGEPGELCVRGPQVMSCYWNRPEATDEVLSPDGWLKTGDIAVIQKDGYMRIVDRKKDMVVVSGFNVYPNEVEDALTRHEAVDECAVIGVPDERTGEAVMAFVVTNREVSNDELAAHCRQELAAYKVPKHVERRSDLPKTAVGKVLRRELRAG